MTIPCPVKITIIILINLFAYNAVHAQAANPKTDSIQTRRAQNVFLEIGGPGVFITADYDTRFSQQRGGFGGRIGLGYFPAPYGNYYIIFPVQVNYLLGKRSNFLELGIGATWIYSDFFSPTDFRPSAAAGSITIGYRYQPVKCGFNFRASFNPFFFISNNSYNSGVQFAPYGGISFGYTIK